MSLNKPTSWLQAAVVATSMLFPGACAEKKAPEPFKIFETDCEFKKIPTELQEIVDWIAEQIREMCPAGFDETDDLLSRSGNCNIGRGENESSIVSSSNGENIDLYASIEARNNTSSDTKILTGIYHSECKGTESDGSRVRMEQRVNVNLVDLGIPRDDGLQGTSRETEETRVTMAEDEKGGQGSVTFKADYEKRGSLSQEEAIRICREKFGIDINF